MPTQTVLETSEVSIEIPERLYAGERCDSCIQAAAWEVRMNAGELNFCNHHYNKWSHNFLDKPTVKIVYKD